MQSSDREVFCFRITRTSTPFWQPEIEGLFFKVNKQHTLYQSKGLKKIPEKNGKKVCGNEFKI